MTSVYEASEKQIRWENMRVKQVTEPLNEAVRAELIRSCPDGYTTSGSDHDMSFLDEDQTPDDSCHDHQTDAHAHTPAPQLFLAEQLRQILERVSSTVKLEAAVVGNVTKGLEESGAAISKEDESHGKSYLRRFLMTNLRNAGYNAGICKFRWEQTNGRTAGEYEVIDVVEGENDRILVDIEFRAQFEIARPTAEYGGLLKQLPALFVGDSDKLRDVIRTMCEAAKLSLRATKMAVPPWRKYSYVAAKWLGPYKRTTNAVPCNGNDEERQVVVSGCLLNATLIYQVELLFGKAVREGARNLKSPPPPQHEQALRSDDLFWRRDKSKSKTKFGLKRVTTSALAAALAETSAHHAHGDALR